MIRGRTGPAALSAYLLSLAKCDYIDFSKFVKNSFVASSFKGDHKKASDRKKDKKTSPVSSEDDGAMRSLLALPSPSSSESGKSGHVGTGTGRFLQNVFSHMLCKRDLILWSHCMHSVL